MKILIVTAMFPPVRTGTSYYSKNIAEALFDQGHQITLITLENEAGANGRHPYEIFRIPAFRFPLKNYFKHLRLSVFYFGNFKKILKVAREKKSEVILLINHYQDIAFPAIYASRKLKIPLVTVVATQIQSINPFKEQILNFFDKLICGYIFRNSQKIISLDREVERYLKNVQGKDILKKSVIVPYGPNGEMAEFLNHRHNYRQNDQIIGVGAIIEQRNFLFLIKIYQKLLQKYPNLKLKIIGHVYFQETVEYIKKLKLTEKVELTGELPHEEVLKNLKKSVFYWGMLTAKYVGLGTATLEAMLLGLPVVSNVPEILLGKIRLEDMESFIYSDGKSSQETLKKIVRLLDDKSLRHKIGQNGRNFVRENLSWKIIAKNLTDVLKTVKY